jgi:ribosomal protein L7Ae-like RNA K-turn-binding protein
MKKFDNSIIYGDSFIFKKGNTSNFEKLWVSSNLNKVIIVHNSVEHAKTFQIKYGIKTTTVLINKSNAYDYLDHTLNEVLNLLEDKKNTLVLISAGPSGKILTYKLSKLKIWAIDTGHCWDDPLVV